MRVQSKTRKEKKSALLEYVVSLFLGRVLVNWTRETDLV